MRTFANCVAVFFILHFFWSYYTNCYRKGYRVDVWHFNLFQMLFTTSIMLPFTRSRLNILSFGPAFLAHALPVVDEAFLISALGYGCFLIGGSLWRLNLGVGLRQSYSRILNQPARAGLILLRSPRLMYLLGAFALCLIAIVLAVYFATSGIGFNLENMLLRHSALRPFAQMGAFIGTLIGALALGRYEVRRERGMLVLAALLCGGLVFYGSRAMLLGVLQTPVLFWMIRLRKRLKLIYLPIVFLCGLFLSILLDALRHSSLSVKGVLVGTVMSIFFGNTFSDTRDFALALSYWNGTFFLGKTYLAGLLSFIPRMLSPFREQWAFGVVTAKMIGFSPTEHAGLRVGMSGEAYLNFGIAAVIILGLIAGSINRFIDMRTKEVITRDPGDVRLYAYLLALIPLEAIIDSVNFSLLYTVSALLILCVGLVIVSRYIKLPLG